MTTVLLTLSGPVGSHPIASDLQDAGISVLGSVQDRSKLVQEVLRSAPDVLICHDPLPGDALFNALQTIAETSPRPVMVFTSDSDADKIARASEVGVHAYVVNGYSPERLRPLIHVAQARFAREQAMRAELTDLASRFDERKMVDRAKAILMRARQVSDDDAFQMLRTASMHSNQRLGRVSEHIIHSARFAEDVNQSGQLRMLSQRLVVLSLFELAGVQTPLVQSRLQNAIKRVDGILSSASTARCTLPSASPRLAPRPTKAMTCCIVIGCCCSLRYACVRGYRGVLRVLAHRWYCLPVFASAKFHVRRHRLP